MRERDYKSQADVAACESDDGDVVQQSRAAKTNNVEKIKPRTRSDSAADQRRKVAAKDADSAEVAAEVTPVEAVPRVEQARVAAKRGKLARSASSSSYASPRSSLETRDRPANSREVGDGTTSGASTFDSERHRLSRRSESRAGSRKYRSQRDNYIDAKFANGISDGIIAVKAHRARTSLRNGVRGETELTSSLGKSSLTASRSLRSRYDTKAPGPLDLAAIHPSRLGRLSTTRCYASPVVALSKKREPVAQQYAESNLSSPPPLSNLQIFAISKRPLNVQTAAAADSVDIGALPSLPIINHAESKSEERKLSILEPPPPGLVSRQESNESWNRFLVQLNSILESRAGEFV